MAVPDAMPSRTPAEHDACLDECRRAGTPRGMKATMEKYMKDTGWM